MQNKNNTSVGFLIPQQLNPTSSNPYIYIYIYIYIYLFIYIKLLPSPATAGSARMNAKEREKKERRVRRAKKREGIEAQRVKHPTPSGATDAITGDEE